jgi:uncharacterized membrane protein
MTPVATKATEKQRPLSGACTIWRVGFAWPILLVVFLIIGGAAGIVNVVRNAQRAQRQAGPLPGKDLPPDEDD